jgi:OOP family OmpA-OmpF porin
MSKKLVTPVVVALLMVGVASGATGCKASVNIGEAQPKAAPPAPPPPPPPPPAPPAPPAPPVAIKSFGKARVENNEIKIPGKVQFEFDKATIKQTPETKDILSTVAQVMKENKNISKLRVEGYTDDKGASDYNQKLSHQRAEAVVKWLSDNGVEKERLTAVGLGQERPVVANDNDAHREQNRRTEFKLWEVDGKPTEAANKEGGTTTMAGGKPAMPATPATPAAPATPAKPK